MATRSQAVRLRHGSRGTVAAGAACGSSPRVSTTQAISERRATQEIAINAPRQPASQPASGTASSAALVEPIWMPVVYTPVPVAGRLSKCSLTEIGARAFPRPIPIPTGQVRRMISHAEGTEARRMPKTPISASPIVIARRVPIFAARYAATGAKRPMQRTGIVPRRPTTACDVPSASWMDGIRGPTPTICGRKVRAARNSATSVAAGTMLHVNERNQRGALPRLEQRERLPEHELLEVWARRVRVERRIVGVALEDDEPVGIVGIDMDVVLEAPGLGAGERCHAPQQTGDRVALALSGDPGDGEDNRHRPEVLQTSADEPGRDLDVLAGLAPRGARALRADRVEQLHVPLRGLLRIHVGAVQRDRDPALDPERLPALLEHRVPRRLDDEAVEGDVVLDEGMRVAAPHRVAHRLELDLERGDVTLEVLRRQPGGELLERGAHGVDLDHLLLVEHADAGATERLGLDQSQQLEVAQRLAHGRLARAELLRDPRLDEPLARFSSPLTIRCSRTSLTCSRRHRAGDRAPIIATLSRRCTGLVISPMPSIWIVTVSPGPQQALRVAEHADARQACRSGSGRRPRASTSARRS